MQATKQVSGENAASKRSVGGQIAWGRLPIVALVAAVATALVNTLVYYAASALGAIPHRVILPAPVNGPLSVGLVVVASLVGVLAAAIVFAVIGVAARRPVRLFRIVATVALVVSLLMPATIPGAPVSMILSLMLMHVVAWAASVGALTTIALKR
jgi:hypothetical protein